MRRTINTINAPSNRMLMVSLILLAVNGLRLLHHQHYQYIQYWGESTRNRKEWKVVHVHTRARAHARAHMGRIGTRFDGADGASSATPGCITTCATPNAKTMQFLDGVDGVPTRKDRK